MPTHAVRDTENDCRRKLIVVWIAQAEFYTHVDDGRDTRRAPIAPLLWANMKSRENGKSQRSRKGFASEPVLYAVR